MRTVTVKSRRQRTAGGRAGLDRFLHDSLKCRWRRTLNDIRHYQTRMGDIQDTKVLLAALDKFISKHCEESRRWSNLRAKLLRRRDTLVRRFLRSADKLDGFSFLAGVIKSACCKSQKPVASMRDAPYF